MRPRLSLIAIGFGAVALLALLAVGCGGGSSTSTGASSGANYQGAATTSTAASTSGGPATVALAKNAKLGQILVDSKGRTLYEFLKDESTESYCKSGCTKVWPPYTTSGSPKASNGVTASKLSTLKRDDGTTQVVYAGHPLYYYVSDTKAGDAGGNGLKQYGAEWYSLHANGKEAESSGGS